MMTIKLPNGTLKSKEFPDMGNGASTLLTGVITCLLCQREWIAEVVIFAGPLPGEISWGHPLSFEIPCVTCPECDAPIMNVGARNGGAILRRLKKQRHRKTK